MKIVIELNGKPVVSHDHGLADKASMLINDQTPPEWPTPAIMEGRALDCLLFTPEEFEKDFFVWPENGPKKPTSAQVNAAKPAEKTVQQIQAYNALIDIVADRYVLSKETFETIVAQVRAVRECSTVKR